MMQHPKKYGSIVQHEGETKKTAPALDTTAPALSTPLLTPHQRRQSLNRQRRQSLNLKNKKFGVAANGSCCGTSFATFLLRMFLLSPSYLTTLILYLLPKEVQQSTGANANRCYLGVLIYGNLILSRFIVTVSKNRYPTWGYFEILEAFIIIFCTV